MNDNAVAPDDYIHLTNAPYTHTFNRRRELSPVLEANTNLHITFHPTLAQPADTLIPLKMLVKLENWSTALNGGLVVQFSVEPLACQPVIIIDPNPVSLPSTWPTLQMYMMVEYGFSNTNSVQPALNYFIQSPNCMYDWDIDVMYRPNTNDPNQDVPSNDSNYPIEIQYNANTNIVSLDKCSTAG
jgi:hypothetical protein